MDINEDRNFSVTIVSLYVMWHGISSIFEYHSSLYSSIYFSVLIISGFLLFRITRIGYVATLILCIISSLLASFGLIFVLEQKIFPRDFSAGAYIYRVFMNLAIVIFLLLPRTRATFSLMNVKLLKENDAIYEERENMNKKRSWGVFILAIYLIWQGLVGLLFPLAIIKLFSLILIIGGIGILNLWKPAYYILVIGCLLGVLLSLYGILNILLQGHSLLDTGRQAGAGIVLISVLFYLSRKKVREQFGLRCS